MLKTLILIIEYLFIILPVLIGVAYMTLVEREILASIQRRKGPNVVGVAGVLQPLADGLKLMLKEVILPTNVNTFLFILAPVITFVGTMMYWAVLPLSKGVAYTDLNIGALFFYAISYKCCMALPSVCRLAIIENGASNRTCCICLLSFYIYNCSFSRHYSIDHTMHLCQLISCRRFF